MIWYLFCARRRQRGFMSAKTHPAGRQVTASRMRNFAPAHTHQCRNLLLRDLL